ncbi:SRC kinase signaling inhibitor 1-like isoform X2 [Syngnathus acus]|uniref:SRC kinase signaling inhibitor 1-like isoform X2 n=1 Tax=Syngnathus acus TaxID=161584 RepID=UPI00188647F7|nr:SRC kinase signaling inhibitor 1-like isoform X2 [Syngnathus acus]
MGNSSFPGREKRKNPMISASDAEFPPAGSRGGRRSTASPSTPSSSPKRPRDAVDGPEALRGVCREVSAGATAGGRQPQANYWSFKSRTPRPGGPSPPPPSAASRGSSPPSAEHRGAMSDSELPAAFCRTSRLRQSLPLARSSASQSKPHAPGMLFLQLGEETRRVHLTHELSSLDTLRALIVHMFPQRLSMATLRSPSTALLIKDENRNVFYELEDPRDVQDRCVIKIYCKEPVYGTYPGQRHNSPLQLANGEIRREMVYTPQDSPPSRRLGGAAPPVSSSQHRSASSSPPQGLRTRLLYGGGRPTSYAGPAAHHHGVPLAHHSPHLPPPSPAFGTSPSAILERRDVKPDDEAGGHRGVMLLRADERGGGGIYVAPYSVGGEARLGLTGAPPSPLTGRSDPYGSLYRRGAGGTVCSLMDGGGGGGLYRAGGGALYNDTYAPSMLSLRVAPPSSPQKIADAREAYASTLPSRGSPARAERRRDSMMSSVGADSPGARGLTSEQLCLLAAAAGGDGGEVRGDESETRERMEVMEKQIASLTGLLQRVLSRAPQDHSPDKMESASDGSGTDPGPAKQKKAVTPSGPLALMPPPLPPAAASQPLTVSRLQMHRHLLGLQQSTNTLRTQLSQLRDIQLENQDCVLALLRKTEAELNVLMQDAARAQEDPLQRQRLLVEEERLKYLNQEETLVHKLHDLERWVEELQQNKSSAAGLPVSQRDLRQKMQELKMLADKLGSLKSQFPGLQSKMRVVLRVEVEAVKFLKEEPHRLDALAASAQQRRRHAGRASEAGQREGAAGRGGRRRRPVANELCLQPDGERRADSALRCRASAQLPKPRRG